MKLRHICVVILGFEPHFNTQFALDSDSASLWRRSCEFALLRGRHKSHCQLGLHDEWDSGLLLTAGRQKFQLHVWSLQRLACLQEWCPGCLSGLFWCFLIASWEGNI